MTNRLLQIIHRKQIGRAVSQEESSEIKTLIYSLIAYFPSEFAECRAEINSEALQTEKQNSVKLREELVKLESQLNAAAKKERERELDAMYKRDMEKAQAQSQPSKMMKNGYPYDSDMLSSHERYEMKMRGY